MIGVVIINLGTPNGTSVKAVRDYLAEFLDDPRVIDLPAMIRKILVYGFILPFRPKKTAKAYSEIFDPQKGSPLLYHTQSLVEKIQQRLGSDYRVVLGMRYSKPALSEAIDGLLATGCDKIIALPLFPQYSSAVNGSALEALFKNLSYRVSIPSVSVISEFYDRVEFIECQAKLIQQHFMKSNHSTIIFSYHSLPVRQIRKSSSGCAVSCFKGEPCPSIGKANQNCYRAKCFETSSLLADKLGLSKGQYAVAFQSKLGRTEWIGPDFNSVMKQLREQGVKDLTVACPSFVVDCLETLEEIALRGKQDWTDLGGTSFHLIPCLNDESEWAHVIAKWIRNEHI